MTAKDLTLSQVFCSKPNVLFFFSHLCESWFPFCWFFFRSMLPKKDQMAEVATLLADGPLLEAFHIPLSACSTASGVQRVLDARCNRPEYTPAGLYPGLKGPRLDYTRVYYGLGQFIPRGILWPRLIHTPQSKLCPYDINRDINTVERYTQELFHFS